MKNIIFDMGGVLITLGHERAIQRFQQIGISDAANLLDPYMQGGPFGALEQGASKMDDWLIVAMSSEGTVRNGAGDTIKMELMSILKGEYINPHVSIWYYKLDDIDEVSRSTSQETQTISAAAEEQSASSEEIASASHSLSNLAGKLQEETRKFRL